MINRNILLLICVVLTFATCKLAYLNEVFRHGARYTTFDVYDGKNVK